VVTAIAVLVALLFRVAEPIAEAILFCVSIVLPALSIVVLMVGTRWQRTFFAGALVWQGCMLEYVSIRLDEFVPWTSLLSRETWLAESDGSSFKWLAAAVILLSAVTGFLCVGLRWLLERRAERNGGKGASDRAAG
jgi:hypothetical protein